MICQNCQEGHTTIRVPQIVTVSREMAKDAGDMSLEGQEWDWGDEWVDVPCECCNGNYLDCSYCSQANIG